MLLCDSGRVLSISGSCVKGSGRNFYAPAADRDDGTTLVEDVGVECLERVCGRCRSIEPQRMLRYDRNDDRTQSRGLMRGRVVRKGKEDLAQLQELDSSVASLANADQGSVGGVPEPPWVGKYSPITTAEDIFFCFRLLLGRLPNEEEWPGHSGFIDEELSGVVSSYVNSLEFSRRNLRTATSGEVERSEIHGFQIYTAIDDLAVGHGIRSGAYEDNVAGVFREILRPGMGAIDVGANVGFFTMLAALLVGPEGYVLAVEPNPENMKLLEASRRANGFDQVRTALMAAGRQTGVLALNPSFSNGTTSEPSDSIESMLSSQLVPCFRLDDIIPSDQRIDFIKMDAEGAEYNVTLGCQETIARWRPLIVSEFSPGLMLGISGIDGRTYLESITDMNYGISVIEEDGSLTPYGDDIDAVVGVQKETSGDHIDILARPNV